MRTSPSPVGVPLLMEVAGVRFRVEGPRAVMEPLGVLYAGFRVPPGGASPHWTISWTDEGCVYEAGSPPLRCGAPSLAASHTSILIGYLLQRSLPGHLFLHGNALRGAGASAVLLLGESGAGKTTLSRLLLEEPVGVYTLAAEDFLVIDPARRLLHPYPRAASIRHGAQGDGAADWAGMGEEGSRKSLAAPGACIDSPLSLDGGTVFLLAGADEGRPAERTPAEAGCVLWASAAPDELMRALRNEGLPYLHCSLARRVPGLVFSHALDAAQAERATGLLFAHGSLPLGMTGAEASERSPRGFGRRPAAAPLEGSEAVRRVLADRVRFGRGIEEHAGAAFMRLCGAFHSCRFWELKPGGTPRETADLLHELMAGKG